MNVREKARHAKALATATADVLRLLRDCKRETGHAYAPNNPDAAHAFGVMAGLSLLDLCKHPSFADSTFRDLANRVDKEARPAT